MFNNKKDPLVDAVKSIMEASAREREIERKLNESLGITSKKALPHELHKEYDEVLKESIAGSQINEVSEKLLKRAKQKAKDKAMVAWELNDRKAEDKNEKRAEKFSAAIEKKKAKPSLKKKKNMKEALDPVGQEDDDVDNDGKKNTKSDKYLKHRREVISNKMDEEHLQEKAPPGKKYERMVKHIKKGYEKDGLTKKEKSIAYATAWKAKNKEKMDESNSFNLVQEEIRTNLLERIKHIYENEGEDAANAFIETLSEEERGILSEENGLTRSPRLPRFILNRFDNKKYLYTHLNKNGLYTNANIEGNNVGYNMSAIGRKFSDMTDRRVAQRASILSTSPSPPGGGEETGNVLPNPRIRDATADELKRSSRGGVPPRISGETGKINPALTVRAIQHNPADSTIAGGGRRNVPLPGALQAPQSGPTASSITGDAKKVQATKQPTETDTSSVAQKIAAATNQVQTDLKTPVPPAPVRAVRPPVNPEDVEPPAPKPETPSSLGSQLSSIGSSVRATSDTEAGRRKIAVLDKAKPMRNWKDDAFNAGGGA